MTLTRIDDRPSVAGRPTEAEIAALGEVLATHPSCEDLLHEGKERGVDLSGAARWLDAHGEGR